MNCTKQYKEFNILLRQDEEGKRLWMQIETNTSWKGKYQSVSWFIYPPTFIERWRRITWQDKIADREKKLFTELFRKIKVEENTDLQIEIDKWYK